MTFEVWSEDRGVNGQSDGGGSHSSSAGKVDSVTSIESTLIVFNDSVLDGSCSKDLTLTVCEGSWGLNRTGRGAIRSQALRIIVDAVVIFDFHLVIAVAVGTDFQIVFRSIDWLTFFGVDGFHSLIDILFLLFGCSFLFSCASSVSIFLDFGDLALVAGNVRVFGVLCVFELIVILWLGGVL